MSQKQKSPLDRGKKPSSLPLPATPAARQAEPPSTAYVRPWHVLVGLLISLFIAFEVYGPALQGEFLFDDSYLPFLVPTVAEAPLRAWLGVRPFLMLTYWWNYQSSGLNPYSYHAVNVLLHALNAVLAWAIVRRYLDFVKPTAFTREALALFGGALFLLHPVQTESVAYVASRSETLSVFFFLSALAVFIYRKSAEIQLGRSLIVVSLFGIACTVKEHTVVLPVLLVLTDFYFNTPFSLAGARRNWRLYGPIAVFGALGVVAALRVLSNASSAGFNVKEFTWYQYLFSQFRSLWIYLRLFFFPVGLNADYDLQVSRTILDGYAIFGLIGLLALAVIAWLFRREFPLASFGYFGFLVLLAPTSSIVPIRDLVAERRMYLPFLCLILISVDLIRRWKTSPTMLGGTLALIAAVAAMGSYHRNHVWGSSLALWKDTTEKSPSNSRAWFQLGYAQWQSGQCAQAVTTFDKVATMRPVEYDLLMDWAQALDCAGEPQKALEKLRLASKQSPTAPVYASIGMIQAKSGSHAEALESLALAEKADPSFEITYFYRGNIYAANRDNEAAAAEYNRALRLNPGNTAAREALSRLQMIR